MPSVFGRQQILAGTGDGPQNRVSGLNNSRRAIRDRGHNVRERGQVFPTGSVGVLAMLQRKPRVNGTVCGRRRRQNRPGVF